MKKKKIFKKAMLFVKKSLANAEGGHDWMHVKRVLNNARLIIKKEKGNTFVINLGLLFHDIADTKFNNHDEQKGAKLTQAILKETEASQKIITRVLDIVQNISYNGGFKNIKDGSTELKIAQDADWLDAIGAIGIARAFNYGGFKGRKIYDPSVKPVKYTSEEAYRNSNAPTLNHFDEKLLRLKKGMHTKTGKKIAEKRHTFMKYYLKQLKNEIKGKS